MSLSFDIGSKVEEVFASYLDSVKSAALVNYDFLAAFDVVDLDGDDAGLRRLLVEVEEANVMGVDLNLYELNAQFIVMDKMYDVTPAEHRDAVRLLSDLLQDEVSILAAVNKPDAGPDNRAVAEFRLSGIHFVGQSRAVQEDYFITALQALVVCSWGDPE